MRPFKYIESLEKQIRGRLPKELNMPSYQQETNKKPWTIIQWGAALVVLGTFGGALLGALGSVLGLISGFRLYIWSIIVGLTIGAVIAAVLHHIAKREQNTMQKLKI